MTCRSQPAASAISQFPESSDQLGCLVTACLIPITSSRRTVGVAACMVTSLLCPTSSRGSEVYGQCHPLWRPAVVGIPIKADAGFSVTRALQLQLQQHLHALEEVSEYASKEFALERALDKMQVSLVQRYSRCGLKSCGVMLKRQQAAPS